MSEPKDTPALLAESSRTYLSAILDMRTGKLSPFVRKRVASPWVMIRMEGEGSKVKPGGTD